MVRLFEGEKKWHCRLEGSLHWQLFTTNNAKVTVEFTASHFLAWNTRVTSGEHTVYVKDLAEQTVHKVILKQNYERVDGQERGWRDLVSIEEVEYE